MDTKSSSQFSYRSAIVRPPSRSFPSGLTTRSGNPNYERALEQWIGYCSALNGAGLHLSFLQNDESHPDSCFVEDTAIILKDQRIKDKNIKNRKIVIPTNIGAEKRRGEEKAVLENLSKRGFNVVDGIKNPGTLDGGDVRRIEDTFYIGKSGRTNLLGIQQFTDIVNEFGYEAYLIPVRSVLHLSTGSSYIGNNTVVAIRELAEFYRGFGHEVIEVQEDERYAAGMLRVNNHLFVPKLGGRSFEKTLTAVSGLGYKIREIEMSEFEKQDGSLSCLSLLF